MEQLQTEIVNAAPEGALDASPKRGRKKAAATSNKSDADAPLAPVDRSFLSGEEKEGREILEFISSWQIADQKHMNVAGELMTEIRKRKKALQEMLKSITDPIRAAEKAARDGFKPSLGFFDSAESALNRLMSSYLDEQKRIQLEALKAVEESGGRADAATLVVAHGHNNLEAPEDLSTRTEYDIEVLDITLVPKHYTVTTLNAAAVKEAAKASRGSIEIPGLKITARTKLAFKPGRT